MSQITASVQEPSAGVNGLCGHCQAILTPGKRHVCDLLPAVGHSYAGVAAHCERCHAPIQLPQLSHQCADLRWPGPVAGAPPQK